MSKCPHNEQRSVRYSLHLDLQRLREELQNGAHEITADYYPAFLYEKNGADYNHKKLAIGLVRGYFLLRVSSSYSFEHHLQLTT